MNSTTTAAAKLKKILWFSVKLAIAGVIVWYLAVKSWSEIVASFREFNLWWLIPAAVIYGSHMGVCAWRWYRLTRVLKIELSFREALSLTMQGYFFSLVFPGGAIGGDVVKIGVLAKRAAPGTKVEAAFTILMDRIVGMIALFGMALALLPFAIPTLLNISIPGIELTPAVRWLLIVGLAGLCLAGIGASMLIFFHRTLEKIPPVGWLMRLGDRLSDGMVGRMTSAADEYRAAWRTTLAMTLVSIPGVHLMVTAAFWFLLLGLGLDATGLLLVVVAVTIANIVGLIPLFPGGLGGRDVTCITILAAGGVAVGPAKTAQLLYSALIIGFNLLGGVFFLLDSGRKQTGRIMTEELDGERPKEA